MLPRLHQHLHAAARPSAGIAACLRQRASTPAARPAYANPASTAPRSPTHARSACQRHAPVAESALVTPNAPRQLGTAQFRSAPIARIARKAEAPASCPPSPLPAALSLLHAAQPQPTAPLRTLPTPLAPRRRRPRRAPRRPHAAPHLDDFVGQEHLVGARQLLRRLVEADQLPSIILWGPPGTGKTTLARIIAAQYRRPLRRRSRPSPPASPTCAASSPRRASAARLPASAPSCSSTRSTASTRPSRTPSSPTSRTARSP